MTEDRKKQVQSFLFQEALKRGFGLLFMAVLAFLGYLLTPVGERVSAVWNSPEALAEIDRKQTEILAKFAGMQRDIWQLKAPSQIFEISIPNSGPVDGFCVSLRPCNMRLKIRRYEATRECRIVPGSSRWFFINPRTDSVSAVRRIDPPQARNIGSAWETIDVQILTPSGLEPSSDFYFQVAYTGCPHVPDDAEPIVDVSDRIPVTIQPAGR